MRRAIYEDDVIKLLDKGWKLGVYPVASNIHALPSAQPNALTEAEIAICKMYLDDLDVDKTCNEYRLLMGLLDGTASVQPVHHGEATEMVKSTSESSQNVPYEDLISRKAAIDKFTAASNQDGAYGYLDAKSAFGLLNDLPSAQPEQRWIPCSKRLPQNDGLYLVWGTSGGADEFPEEDPHAFLIDYDSCAGAFGYWYETFDFGILNGKAGEEFRKVNVIAWQPIEPYRGDDDDE